MADLTISGELAERLADLAKREMRPIETILKNLLDSYEGQHTERPDQALTTRSPSLKDFPVDDLGPWPAGLTLRREELYGDDER
jgi:hypothetical protein